MTTLQQKTSVYQLSPADLQKITDYIAILVSIDRKKSVPNKGEHHEK